MIDFILNNRKMKKNIKKIGIITYWESQDNYGQILQCFALQRAIEKIGGEPFLIKYDSCSKQNFKKRILHWFFLLFSFKELHHAIFRRIEKAKKNDEVVDRQFESFKKHYIKSTDKIYTIDDLEKMPPNADYYVCGSDQIWNSHNEGYLLHWGDPSIHRIAYAVSFGSSEISKEYQFYLKNVLKSFQFVSVREKSGIQICEKAGYFDAVWAPDPTLLLNKEEYLYLCSNCKKREKKYMFLYLIGNETSIDIEQIKLFAKNKEIEIVYSPSMSRDDDFIKTYPTIQEWLFLISNADYVLTNSFHGTVFSLIFNRNFGIYNLCGKHSKMNVRIDSLLTDLNLKHRIINDDLSVLDENIDYSDINPFLKEQSEGIKQKMKNWFNL